MSMEVWNRMYGLAERLRHQIMEQEILQEVSRDQELENQVCREVTEPFHRTEVEVISAVEM